MTNETKGNLLKIGGTVVGATGSILGIIGAMVGAKKQYTTVPNNTEPAVDTTAPTTEGTNDEVVETKTASNEKQEA